ncbi:restriction endonuclease [Streptomyces sp. NPDC058297]|uniref:restriction endonuclease n=1 Tax=Streptomyces sp. NPDC058297 TaxID=3346433 RepID=UPI0036E03DEE
MTTSPPIRRTRVRKAQPRRSIRRTIRKVRRRLRRISWGWAAGIAIGGYIVAKTYPWQSIAAVAVVAVAVILHVVRPARMAGAFTRIDRLYARRRAQPQQQRPLEAFKRMTPAGFEHAIADLARESDDVRHAEVNGGANDRGADVLITLKNGRRVLVQCKRYIGHAVGSEHVQIVNGTYQHIHGCDLAVIVTTSGFTAAARETQSLIGRDIRLVDGDALAAWANGGRPPWN